MFKQVVRTAMLAVFSGAFLAGCYSPKPSLSVTGGSVDFGRIPLGQKVEMTLTIANKGDLAGTLGEVSSAGIKIDAPFSLIGGTCATGMELAAEGGSCTLVVKFEPTVAGDFADKIELAVTAEDFNEVFAIEIRAKAYLDCNLTPALKESFADGSTDANARNQSEAAAGTAAGQALTYNDGYTKGYSNGYTTGYNIGYDTKYDVGWDSGHAQGYNEGINDFWSCNDGSSAGRALGAADGEADGEYDGYNAGYQDGYASGYTEGYDVGYWDGADSCAAASSLKKPLPANRKALPRPTNAKLVATAESPWDTAENIQACYDQGYAATYNSNSYWAAYNAAAAANPQYQSGLSQGHSAGYAVGRHDGEIDGYDDGRADGREAGFASGTQVAYDECFADAYGPAYDSAYNSGWYDTFYGYSAGHADGDYDGYYAGYASGFDAGESDYCTSSTASALASSTKKPLKFGEGQKWLRVIDGKRVAAFAYSPRPLTKEREAIRKRISSEIRSELRFEFLKNSKSRD